MGKMAINRSGFIPSSLPAIHPSHQGFWKCIHPITTSLLFDNLIQKIMFNQIFWIKIKSPSCLYTHLHPYVALNIWSEFRPMVWTLFSPPKVQWSGSRSLHVWTKHPGYHHLIKSIQIIIFIAVPSVKHMDCTPTSLVYHMTMSQNLGALGRDRWLRDGYSSHMLTHARIIPYLCGLPWL